jgi:hypothetical protein
MAEKSSWGQANKLQKLGLFGEIERKLAKLSKTLSRPLPCLEKDQ